MGTERGIPGVGRGWTAKSLAQGHSRQRTSLTVSNIVLRQELHVCSGMDLVGAGFKPALRWPSAFLATPGHAVVAPDRVHEVAILVTRVPVRAGLKPAPTPFAKVAAITVNSNRSVL